MEDLFYIPIEKEGNTYIQKEVLPDNELFEYHISIYTKVIEEYFNETEAVVNLKSGKYLTKVFEPKDKKTDVYFCLVNLNNSPSFQNEIILDSRNIEELKQHLSVKIKNSEGIVTHQIIDIISSFVTPRLKFSNSKNDIYYNYKSFNKDCIIIGSPGSGKTTLLRRLTLDYLNNSFVSNNNLNKLPIYIQLREFNNYNSDFETFIDNSIKNSFSLFGQYLRSDINTTGKICLMLDGADEIDFHKFQLFKTAIVKYKKSNPLISFIITSRPYIFYENIKGFEKCYVQPLNKNQIKELTFRKLANSGKWKEYISILNSVPDIYEILKNPLLLTISHYLFKHKSILPINSGQLLKELVATLISNWDAQRNVERKYNDKVINPLEISYTLGRIALVLSELKRSSITSNLLFKKLKSFESEQELISYLRFIEFSTGIITVDKNDMCEFVHKSMQDYFCSNILVESVGELNKNIFIDKDWDKVLQIISGLSSDPNYIINTIVNQSKRDDANKLKTSLSIYNESILLNKQDIKRSFNLLEKYFIKYEKTNKITNDNIKVEKEKVFLKKMNQTKGFNEIILLITILFKTRFTKYEYDFYGYLNNSTSIILKGISKLTLEKGNITIVSNDNDTEISHIEESSNVQDE